MRFVTVVALSGLLIVTNAETAFAGDCDCTVTLASADTHLLAGDVGPGDVVCLEPGTRGELWIDGVEGDENNPVVIRNCGGTTTFTKRINIIGSRYLRLSGAGDPATYYGIVIGTDQDQAVSIHGFSSDIEVEFVEITASGFAGVMGKTDNADLSFVQYNTLIHDNYIHDVDGEGIYLGNSFYDDDTSHSLVGTRVYRNVIVDAGWDGLQVGAADEDTEIFDNYVENTGIGTQDFVHQNGIQVGRGATGRIYGNVVIGAAAHGVIVIGIGDVFLSNNVIVSPGADGIWFSPRYYERSGPHDVGVVANNTIVEPGESGVQLHNLTATTDNQLKNNLIVASGMGFVDLDPTIPVEHDTSSYATTVTEAGLVAALDLSMLGGIEPRLRREAVIEAMRIAEGGPAVDMGSDLSTYGITADIRGVARPSGAAFDIGAFELAPEGEGGSGEGGASTTGTGAGSSTTSAAGSGSGAPSSGSGDPVEDAEPADDGCGCRIEGTSGTAPGAALALLVLAPLFRRRMRKTPGGSRPTHM